MKFWRPFRVENGLRIGNPRERAGGLSEVALAVALFLQNTIAGRELEILHVLRAHHDLLIEFLYFVNENMDYVVVYDRFVRGSPADKMYEALYPSPPPAR